MGFNVAIDGPAGAGKSTIAKLVAKKMGFIYVDTGALYRAMALYFLRMGVNADDRESITAKCRNAQVTLSYLNGIQQVFLNGENVSDQLRSEEVGNMASKTSAIPEVRERLLEIQRSIAREQDVVMDGRDIGTNILPNADVKIYLTASAKTRAGRRFKELQDKGIACDYEQILLDIRARDEMDMSRETAPMRQAEDSALIDSSDMTIEEVTEAITVLCTDKGKV